MSLRKTDYRGDSESCPCNDGDNSHLDDASSTPHTSDTGVVQVPVELCEVSQRRVDAERESSHPWRFGA